MISKYMLIEEVLSKYPETTPVFEQFGFGCLGCRAALFENIAQGAKVHGIDVEALITSLNNVITKH
jgi:hybrid cluster-associated redox disulfide protein